MSTSCWSSWGVYPRACGGTYRDCPALGLGQGLSPRVRGNPGVMVARAPFITVYPRACGGTVRVTGVNMPHEGLSPRVRGNRAGDRGKYAP